VTVETTHRGPYDGLAAAHRAVLNHCANEGLALSGTRWEIYGDWEEDPARLETQVYWQRA
jgi:effector-binding domain-containing protein